MRRALAIAKYVPAVLCGLLMVAWVVSLGWEIWLTLPRDHNGRGLYQMRVFVGRITLWTDIRNPHRPFLEVRQHRSYGPFDLSLHHFTSPEHTQITVPIALLVSLLIPLTVLPFFRFRFPLWSYFAWTALIAAESAYYLR